jgi:hypothetical protein
MRNKSIILKDDIFTKLQSLENENKRLRASKISTQEL